MIFPLVAFSGKFGKTRLVRGIWDLTLLGKKDLEQGGGRVH